MSKFTKALEKIQTKRSVAAPVMDRPEPSQSTFDIPKEIEARQSSWERGIRTIKEATPDKRIIYHHYPTSTIAEQYRTLRTNLKTRLAKDNAKVIMLSSSINGEGKSISTINLAYSLAEAGGCKIGIIDADLRRGRTATYLGLGKNLPGLSDYLTNPEMTIKEVVVRTSQENLFVIPRGMIPKNPSELIASVRFRNLIGEMSKHVDYLVIDTPPIMSVADAGIIGREVDGLVMVIQSGKTPKTIIAHAHRLFQQADINMYGYILTNVEFQSQDYRYYYEYYNMPTNEDDKAPSKTSMFFKRLGLNFERREEKFSGWWEKNVTKKKRKKRRSRNITN